MVLRLHGNTQEYIIAGSASCGSRHVEVEPCHQEVVASFERYFTSSYVALVVQHCPAARHSNILIPLV